MIRTLLFCLLTLASGLWPLAASAVTITLDYGAPYVPGLDRVIFNTPVQSIRFQVFRVVAGQAVITEGLIPNVTAANIGETYVINAATAPTYGFDWSVLQEAALQLDSFLFDTPAHWRLAFITPRENSFPDPNGVYPVSPNAFGDVTKRPVITNLDRLEIKVEELFTSPIGSVMRIHPKLIGDGVLVPIPEPAAWLLLCVGLAHISLVRRR